MSFDYTSIQNTSLWNDIKNDIQKGEIFLSPRIKSNRITIYYKGKLLLQYDKDGFSINYKYFSLPKTNNRIYENNLSEICLKTNIFKEIYSEIKEKCKCYARGEEKGVSYLYKYNYLQNNNIILLDIEYSTKSESDNTSDRIDIVLYDKISKTIQFVEAKQYSNKEIDNLDVINQIERYSKNLTNNSYEHLLFYQKYIEILNKLFNIDLPIPEKINENVSLYMFDFSAMDKNDEKFININTNIKNKYFRGHPNNITNENLKQLFTT